jgi:hypothetical protein
MISTWKLNTFNDGIDHLDKQMPVMYLQGSPKEPPTSHG